MNAPTRPGLPPGQMIHSFSVIAVGYLITVTFWFGSLLVFVTSGYFFPEVSEIWALEGDAFKETLANDPSSVFPVTLFWCVFATGLLGSLIAGFIVVRIAPFARFGHVTFVAVVVLVSWLQQLFAGQSPQEFRWMFLLSMIGMTFGTYFGARIGWRPESEEQETEFNQPL